MVSRRRLFTADFGADIRRTYRWWSYQSVALKRDAGCRRCTDEKINDAPRLVLNEAASRHHQHWSHLPMRLSRQVTPSRMITHSLITTDDTECPLHYSIELKSTTRHASQSHLERHLEYGCKADCTFILHALVRRAPGLRKLKYSHLHCRLRRFIPEDLQ